jgi:Ni/Fe-hydrogenase subunit HybB-like protein
VRRTLAFLLRELKPRGKLLTPFNVITGAVMLLGAAILVLRFAKGLGAIMGDHQEHPWGLWIGFNVITGVAFAGGAYVVTFMVYVMRMELYRPIVRVTVLNGFLAYVFYAGALLLDLGRPWNVVNPIIGNSFGVSSVLFLVAWHFMLYMIAELVEFSPAVAEWLGWPRMRRLVSRLGVGAVVLGITLSSLHQSGLGALYLMAKGKVHPLWYTEFLPILFLVSSVFAGLSLVIVIASAAPRLFAARAGERYRGSLQPILLGLGKVCAASMFVYLGLKVLVLVHGKEWAYLATGMGRLWLLEVVGLTLVPWLLFTSGVRRGQVRLVQAGAVVALLGIILNRLNVTTFAFRWYAAEHYVPTWMELVVIFAVIFAQIWVFRWVVNRMPVLDHAPEEHPAPAARARVAPSTALTAEERAHG